MPRNATRLERSKHAHSHHDESEGLQQLGTAAKETLETVVQNTKRHQRRQLDSSSFRNGRRRYNGRRVVTDKERITIMTEAGIAAVERWAGAGTLPAEQKEVLVHMGAALNAAVYNAGTMEEVLNYIHLVLRAAYLYGVTQPQQLLVHENENGEVAIRGD